MPKRIQMSRRHPWRADHPDAVIVDRRTKWGNPYRVTRRVRHFMGSYDVYAVHPEPSVGHRGYTYRRENDALERALHLYRGDVMRRIESGSLSISELAGRDLACWCPLDQPCHADVLLAIANNSERA